MMGGLSRQRVSVIANSKGFPDPVLVLEMGKAWRRSDVLAWLRKNRPELVQE
jgi:prophage regulatory protein